MIEKRFLIPKIITKDEYTIDIEKYAYEYKTEIKKDKVYLFDREQIEDIDKEAWNIFSLIKEVSKKHKNTTCVIAEKDKEENINIIFSRTDVVDDKSTSLIKIHAANFKEDVEKFHKLFYLLLNTLDNNKTAVLFNFNLSEDEISFLFKDIAFKEEKNIEKYLMFLPTKGNIEKKYGMIFFTIIVSLGIFFTGNYFKNRKNNTLSQEYEQLRKEYNSKIEDQNNNIQKLQKKLNTINRYANNKVKIFIPQKVQRQ